MPFDRGEGTRRRRGQREQREADRGGERRGLPVHERDRQTGQRQRPRHLPGDVDPAGGGVGALRHRAGDHDHRGQAEGQVELEHRPPPPEGGEQPAEHRTYGQRQSRHGSPDAEGLGALVVVPVGLAQERQGARLGGGGTRSLHDPGRDEDRHVGGQRGEGGAGAEHGQAGQQQPPAAEPVAERAAGEQQAGEGEDVAGDHPLQGTDPGMQRGLDVGQRHADHRVVEHGEEQRHAQGHQDPRG
jgi:hypothetical protein